MHQSCAAVSRSHDHALRRALQGSPPRPYSRSRRPCRHPLHVGSIARCDLSQRPGWQCSAAAGEPSLALQQAICAHSARVKIWISRTGVMVVGSWQRRLGKTTMKSLNFMLHDSIFDAPSFSFEANLSMTRGELRMVLTWSCVSRSTGKPSQ